MTSTPTAAVTALPDRSTLWAGLALVGIPVLLWSSQAVYMKTLLSDSFGAFELSLYRSLGAALLGLIMLKGKVRLPAKPKAYLPGLFLALNFITFNLALLSIDAYLLMVIETASFLISLFIDRLMRIPIRLSPFAMTLAAAGVTLLAVDAWHGAIPQMGVSLLFAFTTALSFALFNCTLRFLGSEKDTLLPLMLPVVVCCLPFTLWQVDVSMMNIPASLWAIGIVGVIQTGVVYFLWARASLYFSGSTLCQLAMLTIPATFAIEYLCLDMQLGLLQVIASMLLTLAIYLNMRKKPTSQDHAISAGATVDAPSVV